MQSSDAASTAFLAISYRHLPLAAYHVEGNLPPDAYIQSLENEIGALPHGYKWFLRQCQAAQVHIDPKVGAFFCAQNGCKGDIECFFGQEDGHDEMLCEFDASRDWIHPDLMPIGHCYHHNLICLGLRGDMWGKIYLWESLVRLPDDYTACDQSTTYFVADSFDAFVDMITVESDAG